MGKLEEVEEIVEKHDNEQEGEASFVFGFTVKGLPNGQGVKFDPIDPEDDKSFARRATVDDMLNSCKGIALHVETGIVGAKIVNALQPMLQQMTGIITNQILNALQEKEAISSKIKGKLH